MIVGLADTTAELEEFMDTDEVVAGRESDGNDGTIKFDNVESGLSEVGSEIGVLGAWVSDITVGTSVRVLMDNHDCVGGIDIDITGLIVMIPPAPCVVTAGTLDYRGDPSISMVSDWISENSRYVPLSHLELIPQQERDDHQNLNQYQEYYQ